MDTNTQPLITVYAEQTPNPESLKFITNLQLSPSTKAYDFTYGSDTSVAPLATALFKFNSVKGVFINQNYVTVTKVEDAMWAEVLPLVRTFIKEYLSDGTPAILEQEPSTEAIYHDDDPDVVKKIKEILAKNVKPVVEMDGGNIEYKHFEEGVLTVAMKGSCSGCPSSTVTLKNGIQALLQRLVPEVKEVVADAE